MQLSETLTFQFQKLGNDLRAFRKYKFPGDNQGDFATRIGIGRATYRKMEKGDPSVALSSYGRALELLGVSDRIEDLFTLPKRASNLLEGMDL